ncbi:hypothetical protein ABZP36_015325 [Zizania latifolia]
MASSSSSSSLCDHLLQDDLPWPSMPCAPALALQYSIGASHQWSHPLMLNQLNSHELESLLSVEGHLHSQLAAAPTGSPEAQAHQLSTVLMMQELGFQWSNCAVADDDAASISRNLNKEESLNNNPRSSSSSCGTATYCAGDMVANLGGSVLPTINVSRLQKPPAGDASLEEMLASCSSKILQAAAASMVAGHSEHLPWAPYGPPAHLIQGPSSSIGDAHKLQMGASGSNSNTAAAAAAAQGRGGRHGIPAEHRSAASPPSSKKPRLESRSSSSMVPSFKVRKEKLGDRIAALQQLVSPFGKTDTASVLMEAIGYIKFLQDQVETLSGPYLQRSSKKACSRAAQQQQQQKVAGEKEGAAAKLDLRSRGLCLVPLSCTSYVTNENGIWAPPNFRGN